MSSLVDYSAIQSLPEVWAIAAQRFTNIVALHDPHSKPETILTYSQLCQNIQHFASGLQALGIQTKSTVALIADNSPRWLVADQGIMMAGCSNAVRSSQAERSELLYILKDSDSVALVVEDQKTLKKLFPEIQNLPIQFIILLSEEETTNETPIKTINFQQLLNLGSTSTLQPSHLSEKDLATLIYTSGTTGQPKGVMLSHSNLLHQIKTIGVIVQPEPGDHVLSILPSWHSYERSCEYFLISQGCTQFYTNIRYFKNDLTQYKPRYMVGVPRIWESLYEGVQKQFREQSESKQKLVNFFLKNSERYVINKRIADNLSLDHLHASPSERIIARLKSLVYAPIHFLGDRLVYNKIRQAIGGNLKAFISGGGSLARHIETFYEIINIPVLVGYGLTETSPVTNARTLDRNLRGSSGQPFPYTEIRIVHPETRQPLPNGEKGLVLIRGPQIMQGYYKKPEATTKVIDADGWFDSGDLGWVTPMNDLVLTGRAKDTIVLSNGENIEPQPIEDACVRSPYIDQIMLVGQDEKALGALIVPNLEALKKWSQDGQFNLSFPDYHTSRTEIEKSDLYSKPVQDLFKQELNREVRNRPGYRADDQIKVFRIILEPFSQENGTMTQTLKIKRPVVTQQYQDLINGMFE
ncbi:long-chain fatty acid--CoA ligase [Aphanothece hegewaldii CCALA 016]|uniref:Long-chain fatty acid--CoA ligase n=1 Tax=Aphanothece hegewaldii CCALA 016 TaxID=2107694 RepID=A0A2T1LUE6_9CHRO|nr:long-chain fatty acid--CoA ligase [Aphanothece hegewaldii]PSF35168.1 long-chain fatty acid--CoA ligase [Aphanothece hegewaldii CCALA 016]